MIQIERIENEAQYEAAKAIVSKLERTEVWMSEFDRLRKLEKMIEAYKKKPPKATADLP